MNAMMTIQTPLSISTGAGTCELACFLRDTPGSTPFHSEAWGRAIEQGCGHRWHMLVARDAAGALVGVLPLHHVRSRLFGSALISSGFAVDGGILVRDARAIAPLADAGLALARELGLGSVELRGGALPEGEGWSVDRDSHLGFVRPLAAEPEAELAAIPRKHRAEVRKSLANPLEVSVGCGPDDRAAHYHVYATSVRNLGTPIFPKTLFSAVLDHFGENANMVTVRHERQPVASVLSLYWNGAVMPYWGGGTFAARALRANERMYFALMDHARARGCVAFDFGRSKVGSGPAAYKKNWGFEGEPLGYARWAEAGQAVRDTNPTSGKYAMMVRMWQRLPLPLANTIGPMIARQLG
ncbi:MAG: FemAB family XrtA/PEP-CTERM system-associated protein [Sphingopyxis sp.]